MAKPEDAVRWIAIESDDYDALGGSEGYGWARATTDDVAAGIGVSTEEAYRLLKAAARKDLVTQDKERRKGVSSGRFGARQVGWAIWEVHLDEAQTRDRDPEHPELTPNARASGMNTEKAESQLGEYGYALTDTFQISKGEKIFPVVVSAKGQRFYVKQLSGAPLWSGPDLGDFVKSFWYAKKIPSGLEPNASYYVWVLAPHSDTPLSSEGPYGPHPLRTAEQMARIGAQEGIHDRAVSLGRDPEARGFKIERRYAAKSGARLV